MNIEESKAAVISQIGKTSYYHFQRHYKRKYKISEEKLIYQYLTEHVSDLFFHQPMIFVMSSYTFKEIGLLSEEDDFFLVFELYKNTICFFSKNFKKKIFRLEENIYEKEEENWTEFLF